MRVLKDHAYLAAQGTLRHSPDIDPIHQDVALRQAIEALQQGHQRRLAASARSYQCDRLTWASSEADIAQDR
jgi:hypothetical protein